MTPPTDAAFRSNTTKSASRHSQAQATYFGHKGEVRQRYREGQEEWLGALGLVVNAIILVPKLQHTSIAKVSPFYPLFPLSISLQIIPMRRDISFLKAHKPSEFGCGYPQHNTGMLLRPYRTMRLRINPLQACGDLQRSFARCPDPRIHEGNCLGFPGFRGNQGLSGCNDTQGSRYRIEAGSQRMEGVAPAVSSLCAVKRRPLPLAAPHGYTEGVSCIDFGVPATG